MDNASKAILIAGGILISIAVMSLAIYMFGQASGIVSDSEKDLKVSEITSFNRYFQAYDDEISGADVVSIFNKVQSNNDNRDSNSEWYVTLNISGADWVGTNAIDEAKHYIEKFSYSYGIGEYGSVSSVTITKL